ncbi:hypothetical protein BDF14DRAFT_1729204 [Spinellus fusiger]|nr:hypothetical protein BDF14DRAFT_1729204 [Spinellus fusiger]
MAIDTSSSPPSCHPSCPLHTTLLLYTAEIDHLRREVQRYKDAYQRLQLDMNSLNQKYVAEIEHVANVQHEKDLVEHELEELSCKLFEEANGMVATEKKEKWQLENQLRQTQEYLSAEQTQLVELRERMQTLMAKERRKGSVDPRDPRNRAHDDLQELHGFQLEKFREYVQLSRTMPVNKLSHLAYLKYCQTEDIEPCLRFGVHSRLSTKKMMEYLMRQPCFIEQIPSGTPPQETVAVVQRPLHESPLVYRFRFDAQESWLAMDEYCRDRLVAVCEFYVFLRNIRLGFYSDRSVQDLYAENIRLRLQMFYSR